MQVCKSAHNVHEGRVDGSLHHTGHHKHHEGFSIYLRLLVNTTSKRV